MIFGVLPMTRTRISTDINTADKVSCRIQLNKAKKCDILSQSLCRLIIATYEGDKEGV